MWLKEQGEVRKKKKVNMRVESAGSVNLGGREQSKGENQSILSEVQCLQVSWEFNCWSCPSVSGKRLLGKARRNSR